MPRTVIETSLLLLCSQEPGGLNETPLRCHHSSPVARRLRQVSANSTRTSDQFEIVYSRGKSMNHQSKDRSKAELPPIPSKRPLRYT